jgi:hypothetical protein
MAAISERCRLIFTPQQPEEFLSFQFIDERVRREIV